MQNNEPDAGERRRKILIVDDDPSMVHILARTLLDVAQLHFSVRGEDALSKLEAYSPDLMLIDIEMPDLSGYEVVDRMRSNPRLRGTQVVMVSSHTGAEYKDKALALGAVDFFIKPFNRANVRERVEQLLASAEMETIELQSTADGDFAFHTDFMPPPLLEVQANPVARPTSRADAITSELFERMTAILEQAEALRKQAREALTPGEERAISRIEEECAEVVQLLVTLSEGDDAQTTN
ncbi:MAG: PleD family two-component system response regulator [Hydrogenophaga sp.]|jgi:DNA-binding response OmpR family regulator|nr:response regulator [Hydrogenophaga sp.]